MVNVKRSGSRGIVRVRYQVLGAIIVAALIPYIVRIATLATGEVTSLLHQTLAATIIAIVAGAWLLRSISTYPGVEDTAYILPAFSASFAGLLMIFLFARLDYSRFLLIFGYAGSVLWFYVISSWLQRHRRLRIGIIPFGGAGALSGIEGIDWRDISDTKQSVHLLDAIATDLRIDLPNDWERRLADYALSGVPVFHHKHLLESLTGRVELEHLSENSFGSLSPASAYMLIKHTADWLAALIVFVLASPFLATIALIIRLESRGPAIFRQERVGFQGRLFTVYKFRTMRAATPIADGDHRSHAMTREDDDRVTRIGRFLRRSRIDELPQMLNILRGEMSWIGPRPEAVVLSRWYEAEIPFYRYRHIVRPGVTGWAQVNQGHVAEVSEVRSKLHYDFYYIKNYSPWLDILIVSRTFRTIFTGFGSK